MNRLFQRTLPDQCAAPVLEWGEHNALMEREIRQTSQTDSTTRILEAGCGRRWPLDLAGLRYSLTGIDLDEDALRLRTDLDVALYGDLHTAQLKADEYDVIYSSYVLEHVKNAKQVLRNFAKWLKPSGLIVVKVPDPYSVKGFLTRCTPFWVHVLYKRYIRGIRDAGQPGHGPYPTVHSDVLSEAGMRRFCRQNGLRLKGVYKLTRPRGLEGVIATVLSVLSLGALADSHANMLYFVEKA